MNIFFSSVSGNELTAHTHFRRVLERLGHRVFFFSTPSNENDKEHGKWIEPGYSHEVTFSGLVEIAGFYPDLFIYMEPGGIIPRGMEHADFLTACILSDTHRWLETRQRQARFFDHVYLFHRNYLSKFTEHPEEYVHWMPYACDLEFFKPVPIEKDLDLAFIGNLEISPERQNVIELLRKKYKLNEQRFYYQHEIREIYSRAKIVLNMPLGDDLNYRTFEAMSCGSLLLTRRINNGQEVLFTEGAHFAAYNDIVELIDKIDYYLYYSAQRENIAQTGLDEIRKSHSLDLRLQGMLGSMFEFPVPVAPIRKMTRHQVYQQYAWFYEYCQALGAGVRLAHESRQQGFLWIKLLPPAFRAILRAIFR